MSIEKEDKNFGVVIQYNLSPEKHIDKIFGDIHNAEKYTYSFSLPRERYDEKICNCNDQTKTGTCRSNMVSSQENACVEIGKNTDLEDLTYEERLIEMQLITFKDRKERGDLITVSKLMNKYKET